MKRRREQWTLIWITQRQNSFEPQTLFNLELEKNIRREGWRKMFAYLVHRWSLHWVDFECFAAMIYLTSESYYLYYYSYYWYSINYVADDRRNGVALKKVQTLACQIARKAPMVEIEVPNGPLLLPAEGLAVILVEFPTCLTINFDVLTPLSQRLKRRRASLLKYSFACKLIEQINFFYHFSDGSRKRFF